jgi:WD40 repeat protein
MSVLRGCSQDGTVRVWDCDSYSCLSIIHPNPSPTKDSPGPLIPLDQPSQLLRCARSPGNTCVRFDSGGRWLLIGNTDGCLVLWSCSLNAVLAQTQCVQSAGAGAAAGGGAVAVPQVGWQHVLAFSIHARLCWPAFCQHAHAAAMCFRSTVTLAPANGFLLLLPCCPALPMCLLLGAAAGAQLHICGGN